MRKIVVVLVFLNLVSMVLPAADFLALASTQTIVGSEAMITAGNSVHLAQSDEGHIVAYQGEDGYIRVARTNETGAWTVQKLTHISGATVQGLVARESQVVIGYGKQGQIFSLTSNDAGKSYGNPVPIISSKQNASIQDMTFDSSGNIHIVFHRHDSYWDYNYARSTDGGKTYRTYLDFTRMTDSNSTGYSGKIVAAHGNLYTVYQDNNDEYAVKLSVSRDNGNTWKTTRIAPSSGGHLGLAVDAEDPDLAFISAFTGDGLTILRIKNATSSAPDFMPVYGDGTLHPHRDAVVSTHIASAEDSTVTVVYLNPVTGSYSFLSSADAGETWERGIFSAVMNPTQFRWGADLESSQNEFFFAHVGGNGSVYLYGPRTYSQVPAYSTDAALVPDAQGMVDLLDSTKPFKVVLSTGMPMVFFSVPSEGEYTIKHHTHEQTPLYLAVYDFSGDGNTALAENFDGSELFDTFMIQLHSDALYILALGVLEGSDFGKTVQLEITRNDVMETVVQPVTTPAPVVAVQSSTVSGNRAIAGQFNSFLITEKGMVYGTGLNSFGHMGDETTDSKSSFTLLTSGISDIATGFGHTLFITDRQILYGSGRNEDNQIKDGTKNNQLTMQKIADQVVHAAGGYGHTLFVKTDGSVWAVGANQAGQLGDGSTSAKTKPVKIFEKGGSRVFTNTMHTSFIITEDNILYGFGENSSGQLGLGHTNPVSVPTYITKNVKTIAAGREHTIVLLNDGSTWVTGKNSQGQLGSLGSTNRLVRLFTGVQDIEAGNYTTWVLYPSGTLQVAGSNRYGQFGNGTNSSKSNSDGFITVLKDAASVSAGRDHTVVIKRDGTVWTSGLNESYQLGDTFKGFRNEWRKVFQL